MTPEAVEKAIQFLLQQQAAFEASLLKGQELFNEQWARTQTQIESTQSLVSELAKQLNELAKKTQANSEQIGSLKEACRELLEHSGYTDFRLNRLENRNR